MAKITGIGGVFFKTSDPKATVAWFNDNLGLDIHEKWGFQSFPWKSPEMAGKDAQTLLSVHPTSFDYGASKQPFMLNLCVDDLDALLPQLEAKGVKLKKMDASDFGKFARVEGPDDITIELWEPPAAES